MAWGNRVGVAAKLLGAVLPLPVTIERLSTSQLELGGATSFSRVTTIVELHGAGHAGRGEDIAYSGDAQEALPAVFAGLEAQLVGEWTIASFAERLDELVIDVPNGMGDDKPGYHRWAIESAALDLALRQAGTDLATLVDEPWSPVEVSLSMGLGDPPSVDVVRRWLERDPSITFKLDSATSWTPELVAELAEAAAGAVGAIDFKALYGGDWIDNDYSPVQYKAIADGLPGALLEDAKLTDQVDDAFNEAAVARLSWDYPITAPEDVPGLEGSTSHYSQLRPGAVNIKPSRFGSIERLLATIALCDEEGLPCYSGGQFELGIGRTQVQAIASLCFPEAPNDCAPVMFHGSSPESDDIPLGPVEVPSGHVGFGWDTPTRASARD